MLATFESILPIFLLLIAGNVLRRLPLMDEATWPGMEQLAYWFLYPSLLFVTIYNADFSGLKLDAMVVALLGSIGTMMALLLASWPLLERLGVIRHSEFSSVFQTTIRWNGFMALAMARKIFPPEGAAVVALVMACIIIPINVASVAVVSRFAEREANWLRIARNTALNPLIVSSVAAILLRFSPLPLYEPLNVTLELVGDAALGLGLIAIGATLRVADIAQTRPAVWLPVFAKLAVYPAVMMTLALLFGVAGPSFVYLALCAAVPTAMNGYLLARQLGGDAQLYAAIVTWQTVLSFFTLPLALNLAVQLSSG